MKTLDFILTVFLLSLLSSCDEKPISIPEFEPPESERVIVLEDLTGASCQGCPAGSTKLASLIQLFDGNLIGVGVHGDFLSNPVVGHSIYDFRFDKAKELEQLFTYQGKPAAIINRINYEDQNFHGIDNVDLWQSYVERELEKPNYLTLLHNSTYDATSRTLNMEIVGAPVRNLEGSFNITVMLTESHIIDAQKNGQVIEDDYEHNHVLREIITETRGDFFTNDLEIGNNITKEFAYTLPEEDGTWVDENMEVVVFITKVEGNSEETIQATEFHLVE